MSKDSIVEEIASLYREVFGDKRDYEGDLEAKKKLCLVNTFYCVKFDKEIASAISSYRREFPDMGETIYVWLCGTLSSYRKKGYFKMLLKRNITSARFRDLKWVTICTIPEKFPAMYKWLEKTFEHMPAIGDFAKKGSGFGSKKRYYRILKNDLLEKLS